MLKRSLTLGLLGAAALSVALFTFWAHREADPDYWPGPADTQDDTSAANGVEGAEDATTKRITLFVDGMS